jgi:hypothetical protein
MMVTFRPYREGDAAAVDTSVSEKLLPDIDALALSAWSFTALAGEKVLAIGGIVRHEPARGTAWAHIAPGLPLRQMVEIRARCLLGLRLAELDGMTCIEAEVAIGFAAGHAFIVGLGFECAGVSAGRKIARYERCAAWIEIPTRVRACLELARASLLHGLTLTRRAA